MLDGLADLPEIMRDSGRRANAYENAVLNLVEALTLQPRVGEQFEGVVTEVDHDDERKGTVMVREPAVEAPVSSASPLPVGEDVTTGVELRADQGRQCLGLDQVEHGVLVGVGLAARVAHDVGQVGQPVEHPLRHGLPRAQRRAGLQPVAIHQPTQRRRDMGVRRGKRRMLQLVRKLSLEGGVAGAAQQVVQATTIAASAGFAGSSERMNSGWPWSWGQSIPSALAVRRSRFTASSGAGGSVRRMPPSPRS